MKAKRTGEQIAEMSAGIDARITASLGEIPAAWRRRIRAGKISEEAGEVEEELIALEGSNPRKAPDASRDAYLIELLDVALAALLAVESETGNEGHAMGMFQDHVAQRLVRHRRAMKRVR